MQIILLVFKYSSLASQNQINGKTDKKLNELFFKETLVSVFLKEKRLPCLLRINFFRMNGEDLL